MNTDRRGLPMSPARCTDASQHYPIRLGGLAS